MRTFVFIMGWTTFWLFGCGQDRKPVPAEMPVAPTVALTRAPPSNLNYMADSACQKGVESSSPVALAAAGIYALTYNASDAKSYVVKTSRELAGLGVRIDPALHSIAVDKVLYGSRYERMCGQAAPRGQALMQNCTSGDRVVGWRKRDAGYPLKICKDPADYPRESYEAIALSSLYHVEEAFHAINAALGHPLSQITLEILPHYISFYPEQSGESAAWTATYFTHNLAYFPGRNLLVVFPETAAGAAFYDTYGHLWESPFAIGHEMGHHLERELLTLPPNGFVDGDRSGPVRALMNRRLGLVDAPGGAGGSAHLTDALLEGFADLVGYYVTKHDANGIKGLVGFGINRNPEDPSFHYDGQEVAKKLDADLLARLTGAASDPLQRVTDTYKVGSVMAYAMQSLIGIMIEDSYRPFLVTGNTFSNAKDTLSLALAIGWFSEVYNRQDGRAQAADISLSAWTLGVENMVGKQFHLDAMPPFLASRLRGVLCRQMQAIVPTAALPFSIENKTSC